MQNQKILIVEDDTDINHLIRKILIREGYETMQAFSGTEALLLLKMEIPDMLILDLMLPGMSGEELIQEVRRNFDTEIPILVISAKAALESKVQVLKGGADDYLTKPFEPEEVLARVYAALRRCRRMGLKREEGQKVLEYKKLKIYPNSRKVVMDNEELALTMHEYDILKLLVSKPDRVYSRENIYELVWQNGYYGEDNTVSVHVSNIRRKLAALDPEEEYIKTVWGIGFKMA